MSFNLNLLEIQLDKPTDAFVKTAIFLVSGTGLEHVEVQTIPPIIMDTAKLLAYLGASVAFFKFIIGLFSGKKSKSKSEDS
jgi:hypothetical protein